MILTANGPLLDGRKQTEGAALHGLKKIKRLNFWTTTMVCQNIKRLDFWTTTN